MNYQLTAKRLGHNWYLDVDHLDPYDIKFNDKICKVFNLFNCDQLVLELKEVYTIVDNNTIFLNDEDLLKYFTTPDSFEMRFLIRDHEFSISTEMFNVIEYYYNPNFHKTCYTLEIRTWTI